MIDIDNFKWYNNYYGRQKGDEVLKDLAEIFQKSTRDKIDKVCRYDGNKFSVVLPLY